MIIKEIKASSIITKSNIPSIDYVINPYVGCTHACAYCYARFMKKFTNHPEPWGQFVDIKINGPELVPTNSKKYRGKKILIASVTDAYMPLEKKYGLTRKILERLVSLQPNLSILTKSDLVVRDIDILKKFETCEVGFTMTATQASIQKGVEPGACSFEQRLQALELIHKAGLDTYVFIAPLLPHITDWQTIITQTKPFTTYYMFDKLNIRGPIWPSVRTWLANHHPHLIEQYSRILTHPCHPYWFDLKQQIEVFCQENALEHLIFFGPRPNKLKEFQQSTIF